MGTTKQKRLAKVIIENTKLEEPLNKGELVEAGGYSKITATTKPGVIIGQKGVQEELVKSGFTEDNAKKVVEEIMLDESKDANARLKASDMVFKVHGSYAPDKHLNINLGQKYDPKDKAIVELRNKYEEELRTKLQDE